MTKKRST